MKAFFDTSSLFKLYHHEAGTDILIEYFRKGEIEKIFVAEITILEFSSVVWKKCRKGEIDMPLAVTLIENFVNDSAKFTFIAYDETLRNLAQQLIGKHWQIGLRTLDSLQLASALRIVSEISVFFTSDKLLAKIAELEGLKTI